VDGDGWLWVAIRAAMAVVGHAYPESAPACEQSPADASAPWAMFRLSIGFEPLRIPRSA
jgi:hypothetical protein